MMRELPDELDLNDMETYEEVCRKYNETYAETENSQVLHAATIAAWWMGTSAETIITFNTQSDERVRPGICRMKEYPILKVNFRPNSFHR